MENYIVRIYRRHETDPDKIAGTFESVENETQKPFTSLGSLIDLLTAKHGARHSIDRCYNKEFVQTTEPATLSD